MDGIDSSESEVEAAELLSESTESPQGNVLLCNTYTILNGAAVAFKAHLGRFAYDPSQHPPSEQSDTMSNLPSHAGKVNPTVLAPVFVAARRSSSRKRGADIDATTAEDNPQKKRSKAKERSANDAHSPKSNLVDSLRPGLILVICGLNPGLQTAATGLYCS